jgi:hypothetical protein
MAGARLSFSRRVFRNFNFKAPGDWLFSLFETSNGHY